MATTSIIPLHAGSRSVARALQDSLDYVKDPDKTDLAKALTGSVHYALNADKTDSGGLISSYQCDARTADNEFLLSAQHYAALTGRDQGKRAVIGYHTRQSFKPGEISPQEANRLGYELAMRFTKGRHAFIVCTHIDKAHIHSHIVWDSTSLDCRSKFRNFHNSSFALRRLSDLICLENGYSIVENPKPSRGRNYGTWLGNAKPVSFQEKLRRAIDAALEQRPATFEGFLSQMRASDYTVDERGKHLTFLAPGQKRPTRCDTLRGNYTEAAIRERIMMQRIDSSSAQTPAPSARQMPGLLIDMQAKLLEGKGPGYLRWVGLHNVKQMAKALIFLQENGVDNYNALTERTAAATERCHTLTTLLRDFETELKSNAELQRQIVNYSKTRATYIEYRRSGYAPSLRAQHEMDIMLHQAAKKYFDQLGLKKLPTIAELRIAYAKTLAMKKKTYHEYQQTKSEMRELLVAKSSAERLLSIAETRGRPTVERTSR